MQGTLRHGLTSSDPQMLLWLMLLAASAAAQDNSTLSQLLCGQCLVSTSNACFAQVARDARDGGNFTSIASGLLQCMGVHPPVPGTAKQVLKVLVPDGFNQVIEPQVRDLTAFSSWDVQLSTYNVTAANSPDQLWQAVGPASSYHAWVLPADWTVELAAQQLLANISSLGNSTNDMNWPDVTRYYRDMSSHYNSTIVNIPVAGSVSLMLYRTRFFNSSAAVRPPSSGLPAMRKQPVSGPPAPPSTWQELLAVASALNGTDFNNDGHPDYALCLPMSVACQEGATLLGMVLASMTQSQGSATGWLIDPNALQPLTNNTAMQTALTLVANLSRYSWPDQTSDCMITRNRFLSGECAITLGGLTLLSQLQAANSTGQLGWSMGFAQLPGSNQVLDRTTGKMVVCDSSLSFPYATVAKSAALGFNVLVNRAPHWADSGLAGMIYANATVNQREMAYLLLSLLTPSRHKPQNVTSSLFLGPTRYSQLQASSAVLGAWSAAGFQAATATAFLAAANQTLASGNVAMPPRLEYQQQLRSLMQGAVDALIANTSTPNAAMQQLHTNLAAVLSGPNSSKVLTAYRLGLQLPALDSCAIADAQQAPAGGSGSLSSSVRAGLVLVGVASGMAGMLVILLLMYTRERVRRWGVGKLGIPTTSDKTTLLVTDIENSTLMWETIPQDVMNTSLDMHHQLIRSLLQKHGGYESATEGDSFICAFHTPASAIVFANSLQVQLMMLDWPAALLESPYAASIWVQPAGQHSSLSGAIAGHTADELPVIDFNTAASPTAGGPTGTVSSPGSVAYRPSHAGVPSSPVPAYTRSTSQPGSPMIPAMGYRDDDLQTPNISSQLPAASNTRSYELPEGTVQLSEILPEMQAGDDGMLATRQNNLMGKFNEITHKMLHHGHEELGPTSSAPGILHAGMPQELMTRAITDAGSYASRAMTLGAFMSGQWRRVASVPTNIKARTAQNIKLAFKGLRVRVGLHSGVMESNLNSTTGRMQYGGTACALAKSVADCGHGGMVLISQSTFEALPVEFLKSFGMIINVGDIDFPGTDLPSVTVYMIVMDVLEQRIAVIPRTLRNVRILQAGVLMAPIGEITVAFVNMVGIHALMSWNRDLTLQAIQKYHEAAINMLQNVVRVASGHDQGLASPTESRGGYLVELSKGLCLATFTSPSTALLWALQLIAVMKRADWPDDLLEHELCEEVRVAVHDAGGSTNGSSRRMTGSSNSKVTQLLFRGPRLKIGIDCGRVHASINPVTGRMTYRGRVMNRAARIADKATSGQVWCSESAWKEAEHVEPVELRMQQVEAQQLGTFNLKGVSEQLQLLQVQCHAVDAIRDMSTSMFDPTHSPRTSGTHPTIPSSLNEITSKSSSKARGDLTAGRRNSVEQGGRWRHSGDAQAAPAPSRMRRLSALWPGAADSVRKWGGLSKKPSNSGDLNKEGSSHAPTSPHPPPAATHGWQTKTGYSWQLSEGELPSAMLMDKHLECLEENDGSFTDAPDSTDGVSQRHTPSAVGKTNLHRSGALVVNPVSLLRSSATSAGSCPQVEPPQVGSSMDHPHSVERSGKSCGSEVPPGASIAPRPRRPSLLSSALNLSKSDPHNRQEGHGAAHPRDPAHWSAGPHDGHRSARSSGTSHVVPLFARPSMTPGGAFLTSRLSQTEIPMPPGSQQTLNTAYSSCTAHSRRSSVVMSRRVSIVEPADSTDLNSTRPSAVGGWGFLRSARRQVVEGSLDGFDGDRPSKQKDDDTSSCEGGPTFQGRVIGH